jgi:hypothetical protein
MNNEYEKGLADVQLAAAGNQDEEVTKQAELLIAELEKAQEQTVPVGETAQTMEIEPPAAILPTDTQALITEQ